MVADVSLSVGLGRLTYEPCLMQARFVSDRTKKVAVFWYKVVTLLKWLLRLTKHDTPWRSQQDVAEIHWFYPSSIWVKRDGIVVKCDRSATSQFSGSSGDRWVCLVSHAFHSRRLAEIITCLWCVLLQIQIGRMYAVHGRLHCHAGDWPVCNCWIYILPGTVSQLAALDQDMAADDRYVLIFPDGQRVPGSSDEFTLAGYKAFTGRPYQKLTLFVCRQEDYEAR